VLRRSLRFPRQRNGTLGVVRSGAGNDRHASANLLDRDLDDAPMLSEA
jgi:hypothetical protein